MLRSLIDEYEAFDDLLFAKSPETEDMIKTLCEFDIRLVRLSQLNCAYRVTLGTYNVEKSQELAEQLNLGWISFKDTIEKKELDKLLQSLISHFSITEQSTMILRQSPSSDMGSPRLQAASSAPKLPTGR